jgi:hypothetical protein
MANSPTPAAPHILPLVSQSAASPPVPLRALTVLRGELLGEQRLHELIRVERFEVVEALAEADELDGHI